MAPSADIVSTATQTNAQGVEDLDNDTVRQTRWRDLFAFTTKRHLPVLCASIFFATIAALAMPGMAIIYGRIFREFARFGAGQISGKVLLRNSSQWILYMTGVIAVGWLASSLYFALQLTFGELQAQCARKSLFDALLRKDIGWYDLRKNGVAAMLSGTQTHVRDLQISTSQPLGEGYQMIVMSVGALVVALYSSWALTLVVIGIIPLIYLVMGFLGGRLSQRALEQSQKLQSALGIVTSAVSFIETVKCFNAELFEQHKFSVAIAQAGTLYKCQANLRSLQIGFMQLVTMSVFVQGFWYGNHLVISGKKDSGQVVTTFWCALLAIQGITGFVPQLIVLQKGKVAAAKLKHITQQTSSDNIEARSDRNVDETTRPSRCSGDVEFKKVSFSYPSRSTQLALREASLFFPAGEITFVVGRSGSGKSTLGQLLVRFYQPTCGQISIDGRPAEDLDLQWLRQNITLVEQQSTLFKDTIRQNIALGAEERELQDHDLEQAITFAILKDMLHDLPQGLDTIVGPKGDTLSGGQKQRVAMARARVRNTPILVLDESTSALDYITRSAIFEAIRTWRRGRTTIVITHDMSQILPDDFVYIMEEAKVAKEGFRKDMDEGPGTLYHALMTSEKKHDDGDSMTWAPDDTSEILSLYDEAWGDNTTSFAETFFNDAISSPFLTSNRNSLLNVPARRLSNAASERGRNRSVGREPQNNMYLRPQPLPALRTGLSSRERSRSRPHSMASTFSSPQVLDVPIQLDVLEDGSQFDQHHGRDQKCSGDQDSKHKSLESLTILQVLRTFWPALDWRNKARLLCAVTCAVIDAACTPAFSFIFAKLLSTFYASSNQQEEALLYALVILAIAIVDGLAAYGLHYLFDACAQEWANHHKREAMKRILMQPREFFSQEENSISRISECLDYLGEEARNLPGRFLGIVIVMIVMTIVAVVWALVICWNITLVALATGPVLYAAIRGYNAVSGRWETRTNTASEDVAHAFHETFFNIRTVRCFMLEDFFRDKSQKRIATALKIGIKRGIYIGSMFGINASGPYLVAGLILWYGATVVASQQFPITRVIETFTILLLSINQVNYIANYIPQINISKDAAARLLRLARLPQDSHETNGSWQLQVAGDIVFQSVNFSYPTRKDQQVLRNVNIKIPHGSCTAIVGSSGSGKSTIASLLLNLYEPELKDHAPNCTGLLISGHDIRSLHTPTLRSRMAIVSQTPVIFPGTVAENIGYGLSPSSRRASFDNICAAARAAGIDEFILSLPQGYQTLIGEGGTGVSGGQAQRIVIARALVRNPDILILDEATSALDVESAKIIRDTVQRLVAENKQGEGMWRLGSKRFDQRAEKHTMTVVIITHAREMMGIAENVIMLDKGQVVEQGRFEELKRQKGPFSRLLSGEGV